MAQNESKADKPSPSNSGSPQFAAMASKGFEGIAETQSEFLKAFREASERCLNHMQSEATLASEFISKLQGSHSPTDTATACQEWGKRRMELFTEEGKQLMADSQKFMEKMARSLSNGWLANGRAGGST